MSGFTIRSGLKIEDLAKQWEVTPHQMRLALQSEALVTHASSDIDNTDNTVQHSIVVEIPPRGLLRIPPDNPGGTNTYDVLAEGSGSYLVPVSEEGELLRQEGYDLQQLARRDRY